MTHLAAAEWHSTAHPVRARRRRILTLRILAVTGALLAAGCGVSAGSTPRPSTVTSRPNASSKPAQVLTVERLAAALGCQATLVGNTSDFRQATCTAAGEQFVLLDFDTAKGQRDWLDYAMTYGGIYLVGDRWVLSGKSKEYLQTLQATLGGTIEDRSTHAT